MNLETRQAYSEVNKFLEIIGEELSNKIPIKLRQYFEREMDKEYTPNINASIPIKDQKLKRKTITIIAGLNLQYWCKNEERKKELEAEYLNNERIYQEQLNEKYNPDNIFKNHIQTENTVGNETAIIEYKENVFKKFLNKIKNIFHIS